MNYENIELHSVDEDGFTRTRVIPVAALASWGELLGLTEPSEILSAIMYVQDHGEPPADANGNSVWAEAYKALSLRENTKLAVMKQAMLEGKANDPRSPKLRAALAALEVKPLIQAAQEDTRRQLLPPEIENVMPSLPITSESLVPARQEFLDSLTIASP